MRYIRYIRYICFSRAAPPDARAAGARAQGARAAVARAAGACGALWREAIIGRADAARPRERCRSMVVEDVRWSWKTFDGRGRRLMVVEDVRWSWKTFDGRGRRSMAVENASVLLPLCVVNRGSDVVLGVRQVKRQGRPDDRGQYTRSERHCV